MKASRSPSPPCCCAPAANLTLPPISLVSVLIDSTATPVVRVQPASMWKVRRYVSGFGVPATASQPRRPSLPTPTAMKRL